jgi:hypothetical protein
MPSLRDRVSLAHGSSSFGVDTAYLLRVMKKGEETELQVLSVRELLALALRSLPGYPLVLGFKPTDDEMVDWSYISGSLPWLQTKGRLGTVCENLREHRLAVVICSTEEARSRLEVRGRKIGREHGFPGRGKESMVFNILHTRGIIGDSVSLAIRRVVDDLILLHTEIMTAAVRPGIEERQ